jgi:hypothetical protein
VGDDEAAAVGFGEVAGQGEAEADAVAAGVGVAADEGGAEGVGGEPWAGVGDLDGEAGASAAGGDADRAGAVLEGVRDQDVENVVNDRGGGAGALVQSMGAGRSRDPVTDLWDRVGLRRSAVEAGGDLVGDGGAYGQ